MARKRAAPFDPPTVHDRLSTPERVLSGPKGALMWKCGHCGRPASALTVSGEKVCYAHGGASAAQRDPEVRAAALIAGEPPPRPPGRPLVTGAYSKRLGVRLDEIVADYRARQVNPDDTDEDMLYLRAHIEIMMDKVQDVSALDKPIEDILTMLGEFRTLIIPDEGVSVDTLVDMLDRSRDVTQLALSLSTLLGQVRKWSSDLEGRHARVITMGKVRAETRLKDAAARQLDVFTLMVRRFMIVLSDQLSPADHEALQKRIEHELAEIPADVLDGSASVKA